MNRKKRSDADMLKWKIALIVCLFIVVGCVIFIWIIRKNEQEARRAYEIARETGTEAATEMQSVEETEETSSEEETTEPETEAEEIPIDFEELQAINPEVYAWITVPGTNVDYPIAQREGDREFYLHHNIYGEYEFAGMIYTEDYNSTDFTDPNTVIYGHNMNNDTMFTTLHYFEDQEFFDEHDEVIIYTPDDVLHYQIFAAYPYDNRHLMQSFDFSDPDVFAAYLDRVFLFWDMKAYFRDGVAVTAEDTIITLSTCISGQESQRYLVQAVLTDE